MKHNRPETKVSQSVADRVSELKGKGVSPSDIGRKLRLHNGAVRAILNGTATITPDKTK